MKRPLWKLKRCGERRPARPRATASIFWRHWLNVYENEHYPMDPPDPIEAIVFRMEQQGLTRKDLEGILGSRTRVAAVPEPTPGTVDQHDSTLARHARHFCRGVNSSHPNGQSGLRKGNSMPHTAPYGSWKSPITSDLIVSAVVGLGPDRARRGRGLLDGTAADRGRPECRCPAQPGRPHTGPHAGPVQRPYAGP